MVPTKKTSPLRFPNKSADQEYKLEINVNMHSSSAVTIIIIINFELRHYVSTNLAVYEIRAGKY